MEPIYVIGHRNPDTDSIVSAMAYAALRNACGDREYEAACLGRVSDETQIVLDRFGFQPPRRIYNMHTQVRDLEFDTPPFLDAAVSVGRAWNILQEQKNISAVPVANEDGTLYGMLSREDVAAYNMALVSTGVLNPVPLFNVLSVLEGRILCAPKNQESMLRIVEQYMFHVHAGNIDFTFLPYDPDRGARAAAAVVVKEFLSNSI